MASNPWIRKIGVVNIGMAILKTYLLFWSLLLKRK